MRILVACEFSGTVRDAFRSRGHDAVSCDLLPTEKPGPHVVGDALQCLHLGWDLLIAHPPCTYLANSGARWLYKGGGQNIDVQRWERLEAGARFFVALLNCGIPKIAIENPIPHKYASAMIGYKHSQIVHPWQFGHGETKATCLWLRNLPPLRPTRIVDGRTPRVHHERPGPDRWKVRSLTYRGIADAMAAQWG